MKIQPTNFYFSQTFKRATVNINAFSDTHGEVFYANSALEEMRKKQKDIFIPQKKGNANITAICGDWFMNGNKKGYETAPNKENGMFQLDIFNEFMKQLKKIAPNNQVIFASGNHEFDGGVELLSRIFKDIDAEVLMTNLDLQNSPAFEESISEGKIVNQKIVEVEDDKNPDLKHKVLFLGISPVNMFYYQKNLNGVEFTENIEKSQFFVTKQDYEKTLVDCKERIKNFKQENPQGHVVVLSHTGVEFSDNLAKESEVDLIFDGHEHKDDIRFVNKTPIVSLSLNFKKIVNAKIEMDDNGEIENINLKRLSPLKNKTEGPLFDLYKKLFKEDLKQVYSIKTADPKVKELDIEGVRKGNNFLANFVTDSVLEELKKIDSSIDFFAINSSAIRRSLKVSNKASVSPFDVNNVLSGIREEDGQIMTTQVTGKELTYLILDNYLFEQKAPPIMQYSGLIIDKTELLKAYEKNVSLEDCTQFIIDENTGKKVEPDKIYKIANVEKYFDKSKNCNIIELKKSSNYLGFSVQTLLKKHFLSSENNLFARCDVRIK